MMTVRDLHVFYGKSHVLQGLDFDLAPARIVALLGRNGCGRSTTAKAIMGLLPWQGQIDWKGRSLAFKRPFEVARLGIGYVPETRDVFPRLTVWQNLLLGQKSHPSRQHAIEPWTFDDMFRMFPQLGERRDVEAGVLSGGEQQMLSLCRGLMGAPELLVVDEPTEGLAPQMVERVAACLQALRRRGVAVLLIEQKLDIALAISDRVLVMGPGRIVFDGTPAQLRADAAVCRHWLEI
jgi:branched-chain amino acid transport system ATP-binding protein